MERKKLPNSHKSRINMTLDPELHKRATNFCKQENYTFSSLVHGLLKLYLDNIDEFDKFIGEIEKNKR